MKIKMANVYTQGHYMANEDTETGKRFAYKDYWNRLYAKKRAEESYKEELEILKSLNITPFMGLLRYI